LFVIIQGDHRLRKDKKGKQQGEKHT